MQRILYSKLLEERKLQQRAVERLLREVAQSSESSVDILQQLNDEDRRREIGWLAPRLALLIKYS